MAASVFSSEFDWDSGNWPKCGKHGVSRAEIEYVLKHRLWAINDPHPTEERFRAVGKTDYERYVFVVYTIRIINRKLSMRPLSARYMHQKEIDRYESRA